MGVAKQPIVEVTQLVAAARARFLALDVLAIEGGLIVDVVAFSFPGLCQAVNLPETL